MKNRVAWIRKVLELSGARGLVFGSSGGKDSALVGILCKMACKDTLGVIMPCGSKQNYGTDKEHAKLLAAQYDIEYQEASLSDTKNEMMKALGSKATRQAEINIAPRLRMTALYAIAASRGALVAGTGNRSEIYLGYFTKWGDGACDLNPIADLTATEVREFLAHLEAPAPIYTKPPSAGLFEGQTDEGELGFTYDELDAYLLNGEEGANIDTIKAYHNSSEHKRSQIQKYKE